MQKKHLFPTGDKYYIRSTGDQGPFNPKCATFAIIIASAHADYTIGEDNENRVLLVCLFVLTTDLLQFVHVVDAELCDGLPHCTTEAIGTCSSTLGGLFLFYALSFNTSTQDKLAVLRDNIARTIRVKRTMLVKRLVCELLP